MAITVQGNFTISGTSGSGCTWTNVDLDFDGGGGTYTASYVTVSGSTVTDGPVIVTNGTDSGGNSGWTFSGGASLPVQIGGTQVTAISLGSTPITSIHIGGTQIWP
jgi:hypothetical protein